MASIPASSDGPGRTPEDAREPQLNEVLAAYLEDPEAGRRPPRLGILARHPELADELASFFANLDHLGWLTAPLRDRGTPGPPQAGSQPISREMTPAVVPFPVFGQPDRRSENVDSPCSESD